MLLRRIARRAVSEFQLHVLRDPVKVNGQRWFKANRGGRNMSLEYPLTQDSLVFDVGGYKGRFAHDINATFNCRVVIFEPMPRFVDELRARFAGNPKIEIVPCGLASTSGEMTLYDFDVGSSSFKRGRALAMKCRTVSVAESLAKFGDVDLMHMNIEGGEYDVLPAFIEAGGIRRVKFMQIQFHTFVPGAYAKRKAICDDLARTHDVLFSYPFMAESWARR